MSHLHSGLISTYNSLTDKHLAGYFSNTRIRRHLQRAGLITRSGRIVPDKEYKYKLIQRHHQRHARECLAQAIFQKVLEMERVHQTEIKRRLEEFTRRERVQRIKVERSRRYVEGMTRILSPRPPTGARRIQKQHSGPEGEHSESSESPGSSRPNTAPGKMQRPVRLKPIGSNSTTASLRRSSPYRLPESSNENDPAFNCTVEPRRRFTKVEAFHGVSPYCLPVINNFVTPVPPAKKRKELGAKVTPSCTLRGRRLRPNTSFSGADISEDTPLMRSSVHQSRVSISMVYFGKSVRLSPDLNRMRDEVRVFQQHCGGENLCVYRGMLHEGETFRFISRRHRGFPFSLTFFLNGLQVERLSSCCEFKHRKGSRLGGRKGHFGFSSVEGASPCYKCIIAQGLDKKPTPPPKRVREDKREESAITMKGSPVIKTRVTDSECESKRPQDLDSRVKEEAAVRKDRVRDDYEEDFEADDEGPADEAEAKEENSPSPRSETQANGKDASQSEDDDKDEDIKSHTSSRSRSRSRSRSGSRSRSRSSSSDQGESDAETDKESREEETEERAKEANKVETVGTDEPEEANEAQSAAAKDSDVHNSAGESTEIDISDSSVPSGNENKPSDEPSGDNEVGKMVVESKQEEEQERAKSVQEKLAEAILKEPQCSSEPELSDTSTEEEEESRRKSPKQGNNDLVPKQQEETEQTLYPISGGNNDERDVTDAKAEKTELEENPGVMEKHEDSEDTGLHLVCLDKVDDKHSETSAGPESASAASARGEKEEETVNQADPQPDETGQGAKSSWEDESSVVSQPNKEDDETAVPDNAEAEAATASETMEMKAEPSEEREAIILEEAPVADAETRQQRPGDSEDTALETAAENSRDSAEGTGDTTPEQKAETSGNNAEVNGDLIKEEVEAMSGENHQERCDQEEEKSDKPVETQHDELEKKTEEPGREQDSQINSHEMAEGDSKEDMKVEDNENITGKQVESEENILEVNEGEKATEQAERPCSPDHNATAEKDEDSECIMTENKADEEKGAATGEGEDAAEEKHDEAEQEGKDEMEDKSEQTEAASDKVAADETAGGGEPEESADADSLKQVKISDDEVVEAGEAVNAACETTVAAEETTDAEGGGNNEGVEVDVENGEVSVRAHSITDEDRGEAPPEGEGEVKTAENAADEIKAEEAAQAEDTEVQELMGDGAEKCGDDKAEPASLIDVLESVAMEEDESARKQEESAQNNLEVEKLGSEIKELSADDRKDDEETKNDENGKVSEPDCESQNSDLIKQDGGVENDVGEVKAAPSDEQETSTTPIGASSDAAVYKLDGPTELHDTDKHLNRDAAATDPTALKGEIEEAEEVSKTSEEGASVLVKPQAQPSPMAPKDESVAVGEESPVVVANEDNIDLVSNWVTIHQASKFFETFVEPLDDLKETDAQVARVTQPGDLQRSVSPRKRIKISEQDGSKKGTIEEASESEPESSRSKDGEPCEKDPVEDMLQVQEEVQKVDVQPEADNEGKPNEKDLVEGLLQVEEETGEADMTPEVDKDGEAIEKDLVEDLLQVQEELQKADVKPEADNEVKPNEKDLVEDLLQVQEGTGKADDMTPEADKAADVRSEELCGSGMSQQEDQGEKALVQNSNEKTDTSETEVESTAGTRQSVSSGRAESVLQKQTGQKTADNAAGLNEKQTAVELADLLTAPETEEHGGWSASSENLPELKPNGLKDTGEMCEQGGEVTEITDLTAGRDQEEPQQDGTQTKRPGESGRDVRLIEDIRRTLSKDRLSPFSVDGTLFGQNSHPLLSAVRTESEHESYSAA